MNKNAERLLIFIFGVPALFSLIVFLPHKNHLALNILTVVFSSLGSLEMSKMIKGSEYGITGPLAVMLGGLAPLAAMLSVSLGINGEIIPAALFLAGGFVLVSAVFASQKNISRVPGQVGRGFFIIFYPGVFFIWFIRMCGLPESIQVIIVFFLVVLGNDSLAWAAGMLFGRGNRGLVAVSPQKSIAGFIGSYIASVSFSAAAVFVFPSAFTSARLPSPLAAVILGIITGSAAILGDLAESALKRGSDIKDSGNIIPGRGGVLDSIDSIAFSAPVFYYLYVHFFL